MNKNKAKWCGRFFDIMLLIVILLTGSCCVWAIYRNNTKVYAELSGGYKFTYDLYYVTYFGAAIFFSLGSIGLLISICRFS